MNSSTAKLIRRWHTDTQPPASYRAFKRSYTRLNWQAKTVLKREIRKSLLTIT